MAESPQRNSSRGQSSGSSRLKLKTRKIGGKYLVSGILQQRQANRIVEEGIDVTPKFLTSQLYGSIDDRQPTALETIGQAGSYVQLMISSSGFSGLRTSSSAILRTSSIPVASLPSEDMQIESLLSTQTEKSVTSAEKEDKEEEAPPQFYLACDDPNIIHESSESVMIVLKETETFFIFEMPQLTVEASTPDGMKVGQENQDYEEKILNPGAGRKVTEAEAQTTRKITKSRGTFLGRKLRRNRGVFMNNWTMHDMYESNFGTAVSKAGLSQKTMDEEELEHKLPGLLSSSEHYTEHHSEPNQLAHIYEKTNFRDAVRVMERIIASNLFITAQKLFTGLKTQDPLSLSLSLDYKLNLLWTQTHPSTLGIPVSTLEFCPTNKNLLAAGHSRENSKGPGKVYIWCAKNPNQPGRIYEFDAPVSSLSWSKSRPNLLAVAFYNGSLKILDVSSKDPKVIRENFEKNRSPYWQVQWWPTDVEFDNTEEIYTSCQDGRVRKFVWSEDFVGFEVTRISRHVEDPPKKSRTNRCPGKSIQIEEHPSALILHKFPGTNSFYFIGSEEGCLYKCSTDYLYQHLEIFRAHEGPVYSVEFSPFWGEIFLTCGADWYTRIWMRGIEEPLISLSSTMACVRSSVWSPNHCTIIVNIVDNRVCIWDIRRKTYTPTSVTISPNSERFLTLKFSNDGKQIAIGDVKGVIYIYNLEGMPFPPFDQKQVLIEAIEKALITKPDILRKFKKLSS